MPGATSLATRPPLPRISFVPASSASSFSSAKPSPSSASPAPPALITPLPRGASPRDALAFSAVARHGPGFRNAGNTCYLNATLQALLHTPAIVCVARAHGKGCGNARGKGFCALCALSGLVKVVHGGKSGAITPSSFCEQKNLKQISKGFRMCRQEDAHEFLRGVLEAATRADVLGCGALSRAAGSRLPLSYAREMQSTVHAACGGVLQSGVSCSSCGHESVTLEPFLDLSVGTAATVEKALGRFTAPDKLAGDNAYRCEGCCKKVVASKRFLVRTAPNSLTVHLKRFVGTRKDGTMVKYKQVLDLAPYMVEKPKANRGKLLYNLVSVLVHDGHGTRSGHYFSYVKGSNGTWALKNDASSSLVSENVVLNQQAYILFYSRDASYDVCAETPPAPVKTAKKAKSAEKIVTPEAPVENPTPVEAIKSVTRPAESSKHVVRLTKVAKPIATPPKATKPNVTPVKATKAVVTPTKAAKPVIAVSPAPAANCAKTASEKIRKMASSAVNMDGNGDGITIQEQSPDRLGKIVKKLAGSPVSSTGSDVAPRELSHGRGRGNSSLSNESDLNSEDGSPMRSFIVGGGRVVRKLAQRLLNYVGTASEDGSETLDDMSVGESVDPQESKPAPKDPSSPPPSKPSPTPSSPLSGQNDSKLMPKAAPVGGYGHREPGTWDDDDEAVKGVSGSLQVAPLSSKVLQKRTRAQDAADGDYDRGKQKKVRRRDARPANRTSVANPFEAAAGR